jgi:alkane 1-monooxygenase
MRALRTGRGAAPTAARLRETPMNASAPAWRDPKRRAWLASVLVPAVSAIGTGAIALGATSPAWYLAPLAILYLAVPALDAWVGEDASNPPEHAVPALEADRWYRGVLYATLPVLWATVAFNCVHLATVPMPAWAWLATVLATGAVLGFGLNLSHELGHKRERLPRAVALVNAAVGAYGHFPIEHNRGHHRHVSTPEDPASARLGEGLWRFAVREMSGAFARAWRLEADRLRRAGRRPWHPANEILQGAALSAVLYAGAIAAYGAPMVPVIVAVAFWGAFQLTSANYVEHYGLLRRRLADGRREPCGPEHSWNSNHRVSNLLVFHLQRHSDHHAHPGRGYQALRDRAGVPRLPSGYFGMFLLAYLPPLWFRVMDPRVVEAVGGRVDRINFDPARRDALLRRLGLHEAA